MRHVLALALVLGACSSSSSKGRADLSMPGSSSDGGNDLLSQDLSTGGDLAGEDMTMPSPTPTPTPTPSPVLDFDGPVNAMVQLGGAWYYGGAFTRAKVIAAPWMLPIDTSTHLPACDLPLGLTNENTTQVNALLRVGSSIYVGGVLSSYQGKPIHNLMKIDATTCQLDAAFFNNDFGANGFNDQVSALASDGTWLYVGGAFTSYRGVANNANRIARLNLTTGALDPLFGAAGATANGFDAGVNALVLVGNSLFAGGQFSNYQGSHSALHLAKLSLTDGSFDASFSPSAANGFDGYVNALATDLPPAPSPTPTPGPFLYVGGSFGNYNGGGGHVAQGLAKLDMSGNLDTTFTASTGFNGLVNALAAGNGSLYAGGLFANYRGASANNLAKLKLSDGTLDTTFSPPAANGVDSSVDALALSGGALYVGGSFTAYRGTAGAAGALLELDAGDGSILDDFQPPGSTAKGLSDGVLALAFSGNVVFVGGSFLGYGGQPVPMGIAKIDADGTVDPTFNTAGPGFSDTVNALVTDGTSIFAGGGFGYYRGNRVPNVVKLSAADGTADPGFDVGSGGSRGFGNTVEALLYFNGSLFVGGEFTGFDGSIGYENHIAKISATDGTLDTTFNPHTSANGFNGGVWALALAPSPSPSPAILVGGAFTVAHSGGDKIANSIARIDATTGIADTTFSPQSGGNGFDNDANALAVVGNDVYVGGLFTQYRGVSGSASHLAKLDARTGAIDVTFSPIGANGTNGGVNAIAAAGSALYVGGAFTGYRGASARCLAKVDLTSGILDTTFSPPGQGMNGFDDADCSPSAIATDASLVRVGGVFTAYRGSTALNLVELDLSTGAPN